MLTPQQLKDYQFKTLSDGKYSADEVNRFLGEVIASYNQIFRENNDLIHKITILANKVEQYRRDENNIRDALINAQRAADIVMRDADRQASQIITNARAEVENIVKGKEGIVTKAQIDAADIISKANYQASNIISYAKQEAEEVKFKAKTESNKIVDGAKEEADNNINAANEEAMEILSYAKSEAEELSAAVKNESDSILEKARNEAREILYGANREALETINYAKAEAQHIMSEAEGSDITVKKASGEAETIIAKAKEEAGALISDASGKADAIVQNANLQAEAILKNIEKNDVFGIMKIAKENAADEAENIINEAEKTKIKIMADAEAEREALKEEIRLAAISEAEEFLKTEKETAAKIAFEAAESIIAEAAQKAQAEADLIISNPDPVSYEKPLPYAPREEQNTGNAANPAEVEFADFEIFEEEEENAGGNYISEEPVREEAVVEKTPVSEEYAGEPAYSDPENNKENKKGRFFKKKKDKKEKADDSLNKDADAKTQNKQQEPLDEPAIREPLSDNPPNEGKTKEIFTLDVDFDDGFEDMAEGNIIEQEKQAETAAGFFEAPDNYESAGNKENRFENASSAEDTTINFSLFEGN